ncbi:MAG: hypothetical protein AAFQ74_17775 [Cyanobacteria bacterium J06623_4]
MTPSLYVGENTAYFLDAGYSFLTALVTAVAYECWRDSRRPVDNWAIAIAQRKF